MNKSLTIDHIKDLSPENLITLYRQGYRIKELPTDCNCIATCETGSTDPSIPGEITTCQKTGQSGWAVCDSLGYMCSGSTCIGGCSDPNTGTPIPPSTLPPTTSPPSSVPPSPSQCGVNQFNIPSLGCVNKYKIALAGGIVVITLFLIGKKGE